MDDEVDRYVEEHRHRYTQDALRTRMIEAGYDPTAVDAALRRHDGSAGGGARSVVVLLLGLAAVFAFGGAILLALMYLGMGGGTYGPRGAQVVVLVLYAIAMGVSIALLIKQLAKAGGALGSWMGVGGSVVLGVMLFVGLSGACIAGLQATT